MSDERSLDLKTMVIHGYKVYQVSTVSLLGYQMGLTPTPYETTVFAVREDGTVDLTGLGTAYYGTEAKARAGHEDIVKWVEEGAYSERGI